MAEMEYFCCFNSYLKKTRNLSDSELGRLFRALMTYNATGEKAQLNGREETAFDFISEDIDAAKEKYAARCEQNKANRAKQPLTTVDDRQPSCTTVDDGDQTKNKKQKTKDTTTTNAGAREEPGTDDDIKRCIACYEQNIGAINRAVFDEIRARLQEVEPDLICEAIRQASLCNKPSWKYIAAILTNCVKHNIHTRDAYLTAEAERRAQTAQPRTPRKKTAQEEFLGMAKGGVPGGQATDSGPFGSSDNLLAEY